MQFQDYWLQQRVKLNIYDQNLIIIFEVNEQISPCIFLVFPHVIRRPCWCTKQWQDVAQVLHCNRIKFPKDFFRYCSVYSNMAVVTSRENREFCKNSSFLNNHFPTII